MFARIISSGLLLIPFFIWPGFDTRQPKLFMALVFSLALGLFAFYKGSFKPYKNIWVILFLAFIPINFLLAPHIGMNIAGVLMPSWVLQAFLFVLIFFIAHASISSYKFSDEDKNLILKVMVGVGVVMTLYAILQWFGFEQFFKGPEDGQLASCGTFGTSILLAPFLAMIIPIALYLKRYIYAVAMIILVLLLNSQVAYGAMILSLMFLAGTKNKTLRVAMLSLFIILSLTLSIGYFKTTKIHNFIGGGNGSNRFGAWSQVIQDMRKPILTNKSITKQFAYTGFGLDSFKYFFHIKHPRPAGEEFLEAHNDYLELFYNTGIIGLGLFLAGLFFFIKQCFPLDRLNAHLLASFICIAVSAGGIFVWQNGATIYYTLVLTGLLNQER